MSIPEELQMSIRRIKLTLKALFSMLFFQILLTSAAFGILYYNIYKNTPKIRIINKPAEFKSIHDSDTQYKILSRFSSDFYIKGTSFYQPKYSFVRQIKPEGQISVAFPNIKFITRFSFSFKRKALNAVHIIFKKPILLPLWSESLEFWAHGAGKPMLFKMVYKDASGKHYTLDFGRSTFSGWYRLSKAIPQRQMLSKPFSFRYQKLWLVKIIILDNIAGRRRKSLYHLTNLAVSRIKRNLKNYWEFWTYKKLLDFNADTFKLFRYRFVGFTNKTISLKQYNPALKQKFSTDYLQIKADLNKSGSNHFILRFKKYIRTAICRKIILSIKGGGRGESVYLIVRNMKKQYYMLKFGDINFSGWRKIYVTIPYWVIQKTKYITDDKGLQLLEFIIKPKKNYRVKTMLLGFDNLGIVEDRGTFFYEGMKYEKMWK